MQNLQKQIDTLTKANNKMRRQFERSAKENGQSDDNSEGSEDPMGDTTGTCSAERIKDLELETGKHKQSIKAEEHDVRIREIHEERLEQVEEKLRVAYKQRDAAKPGHGRPRAAEKAIKNAEAKLAKGTAKVEKKDELARLAVDNLLAAKGELIQLEADVAAAKEQRDDIADQINTKPVPPVPPPQPMVAQAQSCAEVLNNFQDMLSLHGDAFVKEAVDLGQTPDEIKRALAISKAITANTNAAAEATKAAAATPLPTSPAVPVVDNVVDAGTGDLGGPGPNTAGPAAAAQGGTTSDRQALVNAHATEPDLSKRDAIAKRFASGEGLNQKQPKTSRSEA